MRAVEQPQICLLYTSDAADDLLCVDLGGRRILKKKKQTISKLKFLPIQKELTKADISQLNSTRLESDT